MIKIISLCGLCLSTVLVQAAGESVELTDVKETPVVINGKRFTKLEYEGKTAFIEILKPDPSDKDGFKCAVQSDFSTSVPLITGGIKTSKHSRIFIDAVNAHCLNEGTYGASSVAIGQIGIEWKSKKDPEIKRKAYTTPALNSLGFSTNW